MVKKLTAARYVDWCDRNRYRIMLACLVLLAGGILLARNLDLRTSFSELLPNDDPGVVALNKTQKRMGDMSLLLVGIRSPDHQANVRYADLISAKLNQLPKTVCELAADNIRDLRDFFERNKWLYANDQDLEDIHDTLRREIQRRKNPLFVDLGEDESVQDLKKRVTSRDWVSGRFQDGYFSRPGDETVWIAALPPGGLFVENAGVALFEATARIIRENPPEAFQPQMRAHISGPVTTAIESRDAVERDILWVTIICVSLVALSIAVYYRRVRAVPLVAIPCMVGAVLAFAVADLAFGYLNSSTAFLGSIIVGNGINYAIMLMARYEEESGNHPTAREALARAVQGVWKGTLISSIVASASYASLVVTSFRGFYQFGIMGASGCLMSWAITFVLVPAILMVLDRRALHTKERRGPIRLQPLAWLVERRAKVIVAVSVVLTVAAVIGCKHFLHDPFEYNFRKLNTKIGKTEEAKGFDRDMEALFGRWPSPTIVLADSLSEVEPIRQAIRRQDEQAPGPDVIGQIVTIYDLLPGTPEQQQKKLAVIDKIRKLAHDPTIETLSDKERADIDAATPPEGLRVLGPHDLPPLARRPFTEVDGTIGHVVLVYPVETGLSVWNGRDLLRIASVIQNIKLPDGKVIETSGSAVIFGAMIRSVLHDGPIATATSICAVIIIILFALRPLRWAVFAWIALAVGVTWMVGAAGWAGVRVTFLNFIALPITFGIGVEYAVNVTARYRERYDVTDAISSTGGAVAMCSWTTIVGYGSLLVAQNQALQGFGAMAILGEIACLLAAVVGLPALLVILRVRSRRSTAMPTVSDGQS